MAVKVAIPLVQDSRNSYPTAELEFHFYGGNTVLVKLTDNDREIRVALDDLVRVLHIAAGEVPSFRKAQDG